MVGKDGILQAVKYRTISMENLHRNREENITGYRFYFNSSGIDAIDLIKYLDIEDPNLQGKSSERIEERYQGLIFHTIFFQKFIELIEKGYEFRSISALLEEAENPNSNGLRRMVFDDLEDEFDIDIDRENIDSLLHLTMISHMKEECKEEAKELLERGRGAESAIKETCGKGI